MVINDFVSKDKSTDIFFFQKYKAFIFLPEKMIRIYFFISFCDYVWCKKIKHSR